MAEHQDGSSVLVIGATGYIGRYIALASAAAGFSTSALVRLDNPAASPNPKREKIIQSLQAAGITIKYGSLDDHHSLMLALDNVDIVISAVGIPQLLDQLHLVQAIKEKKTIKRFIPSEFGQDVDKVVWLKPAREMLSDPKIRVRRATEAAGIPYTYIITNAFAKFHFSMREENGKLVPPGDKFVIYGDGNTKASFVTEEDIGTFTIKAAADPRAANKILHLRPPSNALTQNETVAILESETKRRLTKDTVSQDDMLKSIQGSPGSFEAAILSLMYSAYIKGSTFGFELGPDDIVAHDLYPDTIFTNAQGYLRRFL